MNKYLYTFYVLLLDGVDASTTFTASSPNTTVLRSASEACNNGVLASSAYRGLLTSALGSCVDIVANLFTTIFDIIFIISDGE